jgi:ADP-ribose pyrophosphatase YjhB (NUDIX family)
MKVSSETNKSKAEAKELLLEDYRYLADSFWKNEQVGETRVNWLIGIVTAVAGVLVTLASSERGPSGGLLRLIIISALLSLLVFGIFTLLRVIKRNNVTDGYKQDRDAIRQIFKDHFDGDHMLLYYQPFGSWHGPKVAAANVASGEKDGQPGTEPEKDVGRKLGGLVHTVAAINSLLAAGLAGAIFYSILVSIVPDGDVGAWWLVLDGALVSITFALSSWGQNSLIKRAEASAKKRLCKGSITHTGGVVYRPDTNGIVKYLLVRPKNNSASEWVLPKGHVEDEEGHGEAALREVREEAGVWAQLICLVDRVAFRAKGEDVDVKFYLMESLYETAADEGRAIEWLPLEEALEQLTHSESKYILRAAERRRVAL